MSAFSGAYLYTAAEAGPSLHDPCFIVAAAEAFRRRSRLAFILGYAETNDASHRAYALRVEAQRTQSADDYARAANACREAGWGGAAVVLDNLADLRRRGVPAKLKIDEHGAYHSVPSIDLSSRALPFTEAALATFHAQQRSK